ncbi:HASI-like protein, partial [Dinothrombium tinctorium]
DVIKCSVVERFYRTLISQIIRFLTAPNTLRYVDILNDLINGYNSLYHSSIKISPSSVNLLNQQRVFYNPYKNELQQKHAIPKFKGGDNVRIVEVQNVFENVYMQKRMAEVLRINQVIERPQTTMFGLIDFENTPIKIRLYENELLKVSLDVIPRIRKIVGTRERKSCYI